MTLTELQYRVGRWHRRHFPALDTTRIVLKTVEEVGELAKARERRMAEPAQRVGAEAQIAQIAEVDAIGDILVCLAALCSREDYNLGEIAESILTEIESRDHQRVTGERDALSTL